METIWETYAATSYAEVEGKKRILSLLVDLTNTIPCLIVRQDIDKGQPQQIIRVKHKEEVVGAPCRVARHSTGDYTVKGNLNDQAHSISASVETWIHAVALASSLPANILRIVGWSNRSFLLSITGVASDKQVRQDTGRVVTI